MRPGDVVELRSIAGRVRRGDAHSLWHFWDEAWNFVCWYVQLQTPTFERENVLETTDHALDVIVEPDGTWRWKGEDDFAEAQALGIFTAEEAAAVRAEGEQVIAARSWPTGWEDWRP
jgi:predicted RNA-binding protein associated with RNAse of E/G family